MASLGTSKGVVNFKIAKFQFQTKSIAKTS